MSHALRGELRGEKDASLIQLQRRLFRLLGDVLANELFDLGLCHVLVVSHFSLDRPFSTYVYIHIFIYS